MVGNVLKSGFIVFGLLLLVAALYLFWQNRASDKVAQSFLTVFVLGTGGAIASILLTLQEESKSFLFPIVYIVNTKTGLPELLASGSIAERAFRETQQGLSYTAEETDQLPTLYRDVTVYLMVDELFALYENHWRRQLVDLRGPGMSQTTYEELPQPSAGTKVQWSDFQAMLPKNKFVAAPRQLAKEALLPTGTTLTIQTDDTGAIFHATNQFFDYTASVNLNAHGAALGDYSSLVSKPKKDLMLIMYALKINVTFNEFRMGHPHMPSYRDWIETTIELAQGDLSWYRQWESEKN